MEQKFCPLEVKDVTEAGSFEGLASVYNNTDLGGDIIVPGAFKEFKYTRDGMIRILDGHNTRAPIGKGKLVDSHLGLVMKGQLSMSVARAREVHALMKDGIIDGLSVGFDINANGQELRDDGVRLLKNLTLWEVSTTPFPMNQQALVSAVKQVVTQITSIREYEKALHEILGFSKSHAVILARGFKDLPGQRDTESGSNEVDEAKEVKRLMDLLNGVKPL